MKKEEKNSIADNFKYKKDYRKKISASSIFLGIIIIFTFGYVLFSIFHPSLDIDLLEVKVFNTIFISILMQAFPFMLIGVLVSSAMHIFIPDEWIVKVFPKKYGLGFLTAMFIGILFPVCECAIVPVMTRLIKKGVAMPIAITFMLSAPIMNPIVIISTLYAFPGQPEITLMRVGLGILIAFLVGLCMSFYKKDFSILLNDSIEQTCTYQKDTRKKKIFPSYTCTCNIEDRTEKKGNLEKVNSMFTLAGDEFFGVGKYLVIGAFITSLIQMLIPEKIFTNLGNQNWASLLVMMTMAFLFSACSTSDAFIARGFLSRFTMGSIMGFMVFGPMMDVKNLLMLLSNFKKSFVIKLSIIIFILNYIILNFFIILFF